MLRGSLEVEVRSPLESPEVITSVAEDRGGPEPYRLEPQ